MEQDSAELSLESIGAFYPIYPLTKGVESWDLQRAITFARTVVDELPELLPDDVRQTLRRARRPPRARLDPRPGQLGPDQARPAPLPLRGGPGHPAGARPAAPRGPGDGRPAARRWRRRAAGGVRRAAAVRAHRGPARDRRADRARPRPAAPDEPAAPGRGRLRQDPGRAAGHAAGGRLGRPGRAAGAHRGARPAAPPLDHRDARRPRRRRDARRRGRGDDGRAAHRLDDQGAAHRAAARGWRPARPAS